jgi:hypothetical protein
VGRTPQASRSPPPFQDELGGSRPAGLGLQDLGYVTAFAALGIPDAANLGAAFILLKRTKELCWIGTGYSLLALDTRQPRAPAQMEVGSA